ncbi:sterile alpha and TIR motif-containing protein 1-like isoform X1 [Biomphalaria pfeifferi]|uniref:ADP-ribosyl cyclase/cyclic ADP-ribose hydrolase n=1 Tax=Biomphalaria pfeifferi TaxID=112525 RepID=A0AAD8B454_BIOPF|nr:sterile alpha and TIR motif-containing protein 1-like isoform X1 [Biomphalaria pfeifferi]
MSCQKDISLGGLKDELLCSAAKTKPEVILENITSKQDVSCWNDSGFDTPKHVTHDVVCYKHEQCVDLWCEDSTLNQTRENQSIVEAVPQETHRFKEQSTCSENSHHTLMNACRPSRSLSMDSCTDEQTISAIISETSLDEHRQIPRLQGIERERLKEEYIASLGLAKRPPRPKAVPVFKNRIAQFENIMNSVQSSSQHKDVHSNAYPGTQMFHTSFSFNPLSSNDAVVSTQDADCISPPRTQQKNKPPVPPKPRLPEWAKKRLLAKSRLGLVSQCEYFEQFASKRGHHSGHPDVKRSFSCPSSCDSLQPMICERLVNASSGDCLDSVQLSSQHSTDQRLEQQNDVNFAHLPTFNKAYNDDEKTLITEAGRLSVYRMRSQSLGSHSDSGIEPESVFKRVTPGKLSNSMSDIIRRFEAVDQKDTPVILARKSKFFSTICRYENSMQSSLSFSGDCAVDVQIQDNIENKENVCNRTDQLGVCTDRFDQLGVCSAGTDQLGVCGDRYVQQSYGSPNMNEIDKLYSNVCHEFENQSRDNCSCSEQKVNLQSEDECHTAQCKEKYLYGYIPNTHLNLDIESDNVALQREDLTTTESNVVDLYSFSLKKDFVTLDSSKSTFIEHKEMFLILQSPNLIKSPLYSKQTPASSSSCEKYRIESFKHPDKPRCQSYIRQFSNQLAKTILDTCFEDFKKINKSSFPITVVGSPLDIIQTQIFSNKKFEHFNNTFGHSFLLKENPDIRRSQHKHLDNCIDASPDLISQENKMISDKQMGMSDFDLVDVVHLDQHKDYYTGAIHSDALNNQLEGEIQYSALNNHLEEEIHSDTTDKQSDRGFFVRKSYSDISGSVESFYSGYSESLDSFQSADETLLEQSKEMFDLPEDFDEHHLENFFQGQNPKSTLEEIITPIADTTLTSDEFDTSKCVGCLSHHSDFDYLECAQMYELTSLEKLDDHNFRETSHETSGAVDVFESISFDCYEKMNILKDVLEEKEQQLILGDGQEANISITSKLNGDVIECSGPPAGREAKGNVTDDPLEKYTSVEHSKCIQYNSRLLNSLDLADSMGVIYDISSNGRKAKYKDTLVTAKKGRRLNKELDIIVDAPVFDQDNVLWQENQSLLSADSVDLKQKGEKEHNSYRPCKTSLHFSSNDLYSLDGKMFPSEMDNVTHIHNVLLEKFKPTLAVNYEEYDNVHENEGSEDCLDSGYWSAFHSHDHYSFQPEAHLDTIFENEEEEETECDSETQRCPMSTQVVSKNNHEIASNDVDYTLSSSSSEGDLKCGVPCVKSKTRCGAGGDDSSESMDVDSLEEDETEEIAIGHIPRTAERNTDLEKKIQEQSLQPRLSLSCHLTSQYEPPPLSHLTFTHSDQHVDSPPGQKSSASVLEDHLMTISDKKAKDTKPTPQIKDKNWKEAEDAGVLPNSGVRSPLKSKPAFHLDLASSNMAQSAAADAQDLLENAASGLHRISSASNFQQDEDASRIQNYYKMLERSQSDASLIKREHELLADLDEVHLTAAESSSGQNISECNRVYLDLSRAEAFERGWSGAFDIHRSRLEAPLLRRPPVEIRKGRFEEEAECLICGEGTFISVAHHGSSDLDNHVHSEKHKRKAEKYFKDEIDSSLIKVELDETSGSMMMRTSSGRLLETIPQDEELKTGDLSYIYATRRSFSQESSSSLEDLSFSSKCKTKESKFKVKCSTSSSCEGNSLSSKSNLRSSFQIYSQSLKQKVRQLQMGSIPEQLNALTELNVLMEQAWSMPIYGKDLAYELCDILRTESALDIIVNNLASSNRDLMKVSARLLEQSLTTSNRRQVAENGLELVVKMTHDARGDCELAQTCTGILESLFKTSEDTCARVIKLGGLDTITYWCRCNDRVTLKNCAIALSNLALYGGGDNQQEMAKHKVPEWLFPLAFVEDDSVRYYALLAIGVLVSNKEIENAVMSSGTLALVSPFIDSHDPAEFAQRDMSHRHGRSPGWLKRLIPVLSSKREEAQALAAFHFVMEAGIKSEQGRKEVLYKIGAVEPLKWLASTPNRVASKLAAQALKIIGEEVPHKLSQQVPLWTCDDVTHWISQGGFSAYTDKFQMCQVDGDLLLRLTEEELSESLDMTCPITRKRFLRELRDLKISSDYTSCDPSMLGAWLQDVGEDMSQYTYQMLNTGVDRPLLRFMKDNHLLEDCKISNGIHRMKILAKIEELRSSLSSSASSAPNDSVDGMTCHKPPIDVFISYRRSNGSQLARRVHKDIQKYVCPRVLHLILLKVHLQLRGFTVFIDIEKLRAGKFDESLLESVKQAKNFIIVLTPNSLDRCIGDSEKKDWVHREITAAIEAGSNIIPLLDNFKWPSPDTLPEDMRNVCYFNAVRWIHDYQDACVDKLEQFLRGEPNPQHLANLASTASNTSSSSTPQQTTSGFESPNSPPYQRAQGLSKTASVESPGES